MRPFIDHGILSPSGKVSKQSRKKAMEQATRELFPYGLASPSCIQPSEKETLLRRAKELRELASRGMSPRKYLKEAERLEKKALSL